ncbi:MULTISPECIES: hypothetical protein [Acidianus]|uniref:Uncharacterized protein n=1 Tax=Candidatus Acidianus copahuensis TaxID=1160895 RepID=A0A031LPT9_9CREN|nr:MULTISPECIES: hypothetical protein [Acidianus]EZQ07102.1 hypothetical protein CM19_05285 [Candidatus Acidianus copahuensis]NON61799.1 hypothetical protein [Acidianus sp. RZ1]
MPYVEGGICYPGEKEVKIRDVIVVRPFSALVGDKFIAFPPLSVISNMCSRSLKGKYWVDGVRVKGNEEIIFHKGKIMVNAKIKILSPEFTPGYVLSKLISGKKISIEPANSKNVIVEANGFPLIYIEKSKIHVASIDEKAILQAAAYSLLYYISSEYSEEL